MVRGNVDLKMSLEEIRSLININKTSWDNIEDTNCYAFALGLDIPEYKIIDNAYIPGVISGSSFELWNCLAFEYKDLISNIYNDLDTLRIQYRDINFDDKIDDDEWKVALFTTPYFSFHSDFHFLRLCNDGLWHHKNGYKNIPTTLDDNNNLIINPEKCLLKYRKYSKCLCLKLK